MKCVVTVSDYQNRDIKTDRRMDHQRVHRIGNRTYYRSNYVQSANARPTIEERLHAQGISTSSNSSWTFSNSHSDLPKKKKGRLCGMFLMVAVFVVLLAVIAIGGLAFYLGAVRADNAKQELIFDGSLRVTYGDQYQPLLSNRSGKAYREKATRYSNMLMNVYQRSIVGAALDDVTVLKFENGSLIVHFRMNLDRRKLPNSVTAVEEVLKNILLEEISSVKPIAFRNLQVDHQNLHIKRYLGDVDSIPESHHRGHDNGNVETTSAKAVEVKNGVVRKVPGQDAKPPHETASKPQQNKTTIPEGAIIGISEKMQNLSDTLKKRQEGGGSTTAAPVSEEDIKSVDFRKETDFMSGSEEPTAEVAAEEEEEEEDKKPSAAVGVFEEVPTDTISGTMNGHARPPFDVGLREPVFYTPSQITPNPSFRTPEDDEPWRPIIPSSRKEYIVTEEPKLDAYDELVMAEAPPEEVPPITFSKESYEENLRVVPDYDSGDKLTRLTEEIIKKYEELMKQRPPEDHDFDVIPVTIPSEESPPPEEVKDVKNESMTPVSADSYDSKLPLGLDQIISGIRVIGTEEETEEPATEMTTARRETTTKKDIKRVDVPLESSDNATVKNPFQEAEDSRSAPAFGFDLPDFPILKQFHHLDSLLKSFSSESSTEDSTRPTGYGSNETTMTRFPVRTKPTTDKPEEKVYVAVSTIAPENATAKKPESYRTPIVIKGEVQVLDTKNVRANVATTEPPKLITLLPVRSNLRGPLRPRPKVVDSSESRKSKMNSDFSSFPRVLYSIPQKHHFVDDKDGKRWVYYSSSKLLTTSAAPTKPEKLFIVTPESEKPVATSPSEIVRDESTEVVTIDDGDQSLEVSESREEPEAEDTDVSKVTNTSELINRIVNIMENVVISTGNATKVITKVNQTIINGTDGGGVKLNETASSDPKFVISNKAVSSHYKLNQAGVPILTKILNKAPGYYKNEKNETDVEGKEGGDVTLRDCDSSAFSCGNGTCLPMTARCNQQVDCPDAEDERNCTCAEHLRTQHLNRKLCDGIVDCWDFSDEFDCEWCKGKDYLCSNSKVCIKKTQICDGVNNCPLGDDERYCVTVSPNEKEANSFNYHPNGYLMVRKHGEWGRLCIDNFDIVSMRSKTGWKISDLGRSVCKALTFKDFDKVERLVSVPNEGRSVDSSETGRYYELSYNDVTSLEESSTRDSALSFHETQCRKKEVVKVTCTELECGLRPQATNQWSRIVGGGNANPGSWPWQAALYREGEFQCGATLISGQWLVSAGHCFYRNQEEYWVARLGTLRTTSSMPSPYEQLRQISKIILHPHYVDTGFINDISLLKMAEPVTFTDYVRPICLPKPNTKIVDGMMCTVVGWGQLFEIGRIFPDTLQEVQLPVISSTECRKRTVFLPLYKITDDMFCAGYDRGGRDACLGDSGGPLMCQETDGKWSLYGVTSNGYGCARSNRPGVYTKVSKYLNWIQAQMHLYTEDEILSQSSLKQLSISNSEDVNRKNNSTDKATDTLIRLISERVSNVKFNGGSGKKRDKCKGHRCPLGECLSKSRLCNGFIECSDGSDEKDCW